MGKIQTRYLKFLSNNLNFELLLTGFLGISNDTLGGERKKIYRFY